MSSSNAQTIAQLVDTAPNAERETRPIKASPFLWVVPSSIEPRRWLFGDHYIRGYLSGTIAPGGVGKSSFATVEALSMTTGRPLLNVRPIKKLRVWYLNGEDPLEEMNRRVAALCLHYGIAREEIGDRLFLDSGRETKIVLAQENRNGLVIAHPVVNAIKNTIEDNKIDVLIIDPFVSTHAVSENDNSKVNTILQQWAGIAGETNCAIELLHHTRKGGIGHGENTVDDARGAGALVAALRSTRTLNVMTKEEAEKYDVEERRGFFRVNVGKANMARSSEKADWFELVSVGLGNARGPYPEDQVGVVVPWKAPGLCDDFEIKDIREIQDLIAQKDYRENDQANSWAGEVVADVLKLDLQRPANRRKVKVLLRVWVSNGLFVVVEKPVKGELKRFLQVGNRADEAVVFK